MTPEIAFWAFVGVLIVLSMFGATGGGQKSSGPKPNGQESSPPRRVIIETLDSRGQVIKRETGMTTEAGDRAQRAPRSR